MDIKTEIEIKYEPLEISEDAKNRDQSFELEAQFGEIQIFPDNEANGTLLEGIKNEDLDEFVKSEMIKSGMESVFGKGVVSSDSIKSDNILKFKMKSDVQHLKKFMTLKNVSSLLKKIDENGFKSQFESDEERFFAELLKSKFPLVTLKKWSEEKLKISISVEANEEDDDNHKSKISLFNEPEASKQNQGNEKQDLEKYCCTCCNCSFNNEDELKSHLKSNKRRKFRCAHCNYEGSLKTYLRRHMLTHANFTFKCSKCNYKSNQKRNLKKHMLTHANYKFFKCLDCSYETNNRSNLKSHMLTHANYKLFKCAECNYQCNRRRRLQTHMLEHVNIKLFKCSVCNYETNFKEHLKLHMLIPTKYKLFKCIECSYECNYKVTLKRHILTHSNSEFNYECNQKEDLNMNILNYLDIQSAALNEIIKESLKDEHSST